MSRSIILRFLFLVSVTFLLLSLANAMPANVERQADSLGSPTTLMTTQTTQTVMGPMIRTCTIILTPITDASGKSAVQEVKSCTLSTNAAGSSGDTQSPSGSPGATGTSSSTTSSTSTGTSSSPTAVPSPTAAYNSTTTISSSDSSSSTASSTPTQTDPTPVTTLGIPPPAPTSPASTASTAGAKAATTTTSPVPVAASAAADATSSSNSSDGSFTLPGKHLSVLPIGLGVFAGISVIALIVVGLVTYERTKYRKAFRQRKLAEAGSVMGYGGMAQRTP